MYHQKQATWSALVHKSVFDELLFPARDRLPSKSLDVEGAGMWLDVIPSEALGLLIPSNEFTLLLHWWLGEHFFGPSFSCSWCGSQADIFGDHAVSRSRSASSDCN